MADALADAGELDGYHLLPAVQGDLLDKLGRFDEARTAFEKAAALAQNDQEQTLMARRAVAAGRPLS